MDPVPLLKQHIRQEIQAKRLKLTTDMQQQKSALLTQLILKLPEFKLSQHIAAYWPVNNEINPLAVLQAAFDKGKKCYLPHMNPATQSLKFISYQPDEELIKNPAGIFEPKSTEQKTILASNLDLVLLPLVAFDRKGNRLGTGMGYYDRAFAFLQNLPSPKKPFLLALAYDLQCVKTIPSDEWDVPPNGIITETKLLRFF